MHKDHIKAANEAKENGIFIRGKIQIQSTSPENEIETKKKEREKENESETTTHQKFFI